MTNNKLSNYLDAVRSALDDHPEKDDIIQELQAHIWDSANHLSSDRGYTVDEAFDLALDQMEDPAKLAKKFDYEQTKKSIQWNEPKPILPGKNLNPNEFIALGVIAFFSASVILSLISWFGETTGTDLSLLNLLVNIIQIGIIIALLLSFLYVRNEQEFNKQMQNIKLKFEKFKNSETQKISNDFKIKISALSFHFQGLLQIGLGIAGIVFALYITFIAEWQLFNQYWFNIGIYLTIFIFLLDVIEGTIKMFVGEIRISKLISGIVQIFGFISAIILAIFYPFELSTWFETITNPTGVSVINAISSVSSNPDYHFRIFIIIVGIFQLMEALINLVRFGRWKTSQNRSLTIKSTIN